MQTESREKSRENAKENIQNFRGNKSDIRTCHMSHIQTHTHTHKYTYVAELTLCKQPSLVVQPQPSPLARSAIATRFLPGNHLPFYEGSSSSPAIFPFSQLRVCLFFFLVPAFVFPLENCVVAGCCDFISSRMQPCSLPTHTTRS